MTDAESSYKELDELDDDFEDEVEKKPLEVIEKIAESFENPKGMEDDPDLVKPDQNTTNATNATNATNPANPANAPTNTTMEEELEKMKMDKKMMAQAKAMQKLPKDKLMQLLMNMANGKGFPSNNLNAVDDKHLKTARERLNDIKYQQRKGRMIKINKEFVDIKDEEIKVEQRTKARADAQAKLDERIVQHKSEHVHTAACKHDNHDNHNNENNENNEKEEHVHTLACNHTDNHNDNHDDKKSEGLVEDEQDVQNVQDQEDYAHNHTGEKEKPKPETKIGGGHRRKKIPGNRKK